MQKLAVYTIFHLNLLYSSIEEEQRLEVIRRCYWPLLNLAREYNLPFGIEASGYTLETVATIDPAWLVELRRLTTEGPCELVGSGYAQIIGPLVPAEVNAANLRLGHQVYEKLLGMRPQVALVNEQAYSAGLIQHYLDAGYRAIIIDWDNPARYHPDWDPEWRYLPQIACGQHGEEIPVIWNKSIAFQKFQRYAHGDMELDEYLDYLLRHLAETPRTFLLYGNDVEIFGFRPGRYHTEAVLQEEEWKRIKRLLEALMSDGRFQFITPGQVLELMHEPRAGYRLHLESHETPIPVKKQGKYNISRWGVTGRDDLGINTVCWRIFKALKENPRATDSDWRELCYLWSSDFRTHITDKRWSAYQKRLVSFEERVGPKTQRTEPFVSLSPAKDEAHALPPNVRVDRNGGFVTLDTDRVKVRLNCRRGLAIDRLWFKKIADDWLCGTMHHGYYDDIQWGADYYSGHLVFDAPGQPKITDLNQVDPMITYDADSNRLLIRASTTTPLGPVHKQIFVSRTVPRVDLGYIVDWPNEPIGSLRLGCITLNPTAFNRDTLFYRTHNGGNHPETFYLKETDVDHTSPVSFLVSAQSGFGITKGIIEIGDAEYALRVHIQNTLAALLPMLTFQQIGSTYFCRLTFSAQEMDETSRLDCANLPGLFSKRAYMVSITV